MNSRKVNSRIRELETLAVLALFFLALGVFTRLYYLLYIAVTLLVIAVFIRPLASIITRLWLGFSLLLGRVNSTFILTLVFYLLLTPLAFVYRRFNRDPLKLLQQKQAGSLFSIREHTFVKEDLDKMW